MEGIAQMRTQHTLEGTRPLPLLVGLVGDRIEPLLADPQLRADGLELRGDAAQERVARLDQDAHELVRLERSQRDQHRAAADELGDHPVGDQVHRLERP